MAEVHTMLAGTGWHGNWTDEHLLVTPDGNVRHDCAAVFDAEFEKPYAQATASPSRPFNAIAEPAAPTPAEGPAIICPIANSPLRNEIHHKQPFTNDQPLG